MNHAQKNRISNRGYALEQQAFVDAKGEQKMAKKKERISENLSDYATYFEEWFSLDYSKLMPTDDAKPKQSDDSNAGKSVQVKKTVNQHAMRRRNFQVLCGASQ